MKNEDFRSLVKEILGQARREALNETFGDVPTRDALIREFGDEFGDIDLGGWSDLVKVMGSPQSVVQTALGSIANVSNKFHTMLSTIIRGLPSLVIPFVQTRYDKIFKRAEQRQREIERMYPEIFTVARKGFPKDAELFAFMVNPVLMTAVRAGKMGSNVALDLVDALSGHSPDVITRTRPLRRRVGQTRFESVDLRSSLLELDLPDLGTTDWASQVPEKQGQDAPENASPQNAPPRVPKKRPAPTKQVKRLLNDGSFKSLLDAKDPVQEIKMTAHGIYTDALKNVIDEAQSIARAESLEDLEKLGLKPTPQVRKAEDTPEVLGEVLAAMKAYSIDLIVERLSTQVKEFEKLRIPRETKIYDAFEKVIMQVKGMAPKKDQGKGPGPVKAPTPGSNGGTEQPSPVA